MPRPRLLRLSATPPRTLAKATRPDTPRAMGPDTRGSMGIGIHPDPATHGAPVLGPLAPGQALTGPPLGIIGHRYYSGYWRR